MYVNMYETEDMRCRIESYPVRCELVMEPRTSDIVSLCKPVRKRRLEMSNRAISGSMQTRGVTKDFIYCASIWKHV